MGWLLVDSVVGFVASMMAYFFTDDYKDYGEVPIPGTRTLHLPAGDVTVSFHSSHTEGFNGWEGGSDLPIPQDLEMTITPPSGVAEPNVTESMGETTTSNDDAHRPVRVAHISQAGDYTIKTNGKVTPFVSPRLAFGHPSRFSFLPWLFGGLCVVTLVAFLTTMRRGMRTESDAMQPIMWGPDLLASGQRVRGVLKSFRATGETMRNQGITPSRPEFLDYPYYALAVELRLPNRAPVLGGIQQPVPLTEVPNLAIGRELNCAVDPADPANRFIIDWS